MSGGLPSDKFSRITISRTSENAFQRSKEDMFSLLIFVLGWTVRPNLQSILHEYGRQNFDIVSRNLIASETS